MKLNAHLTIHELENLSEESSGIDRRESSFLVKIEWRGSERMIFGFLSTTKKNYTMKQPFRHNGIVKWDEGCSHICRIEGMNDQNWKSWLVNLEIQEFKQNHRGKKIIGKACIDIAEYVPQLSAQTVERTNISIPIKYSAAGYQIVEPILKVELRLVEIKTEGIAARLTRALSASSCTGSWQNSSYELSNRYVYPSAPDTLSEEAASEINYGPLHSANILLNTQEGDKIERRIEEKEIQPKRSPEKAKEQTSLVRRLSGKLSFKNNSNPEKGEPLLNKERTEVGGDDIDNERHQNSSFSTEKHKGKSFRFEDGEFEVGVWENTKIPSRDGEMELKTDILLASFDQRNVKVGGDGACSVLAVVIASWLHSNPTDMPIKCQFDDLIHEGSLAWRNLCKDESLRARFPNKHFDIKTVLQSNMCPLLEDETSILAFFRLDDGMMDDAINDDNKPDDTVRGLHEQMPFDGIWDGLISSAECKDRIYIASWNDHFFVLKIGSDAVYLIDTLGERLFEGCDKAYILKFDKDTEILRSSAKGEQETGGSGSNCDKKDNKDGKKVSDGCNRYIKDVAENGEELGSADSSEEVICIGIQSCREYIKRFLVAVPLKQLQQDIKTDRLIDGSIVNRLVQIEFHHTYPYRWNV